MAHIAEIIKYEGDNSTFIWKHPCEDFNTSTQLIVHESQEAVFYMNGHALDSFGPGHYTLETQNIPFLRRFVNIPTGGETPFHCEVYFINKTVQMAIKWGVDSRVQYLEPTYGFPLSIGVSGEMALSVADSRKLLIRIVGTEPVLNRDSLTSIFRAFLMTKVKTYIAQEMKAGKINIFEIDEKLEDFSSGIKSKLDADFLDYGVNLERFLVTVVSKPDGEPQYEKYKDLHFRQYADIADAELRQRVGVIEQRTKAQQMVIEAEGIARKRATEGYTYQQERGFDVAEKVAENEAVGQFTNMGVGLGTMASVGGAVGGLVGGALNNAFTSTGEPSSAVPSRFCDQCGAVLSPDAAFCEQCGAPLKSDKSCPNCGHTFLRPGKFCPKCGARRGDD